MPCSARLISALVFVLAAGFSQAELVATFTRDGATDSQMDRFPALHVLPGEPATPFLTAGAFEAVWRGKLIIPRRQRLVFSFEGEGIATLKIAGKEVLVSEGGLPGKASESTRLNPGEHEFELTYLSKPDGSGGLRVFWQELSFPRQSMPASAFVADSTEDTKLGALHRRGRYVFAHQNCTKCHTTTAGLGSTPMPEIAEIAPIIFGTGDRTSEEWLRRWMAAPHTLKPTSQMPDLVDTSTAEGRQQASDLAAYMVSLKIGTPPSMPADATLAKEGGMHFHELGCVGCHYPPDKSESDSSRVPLNNVASKYLPGALTAYLKQPDAMHPFTKMPNFRLTDAEAASIAAFLTTASEGKQTQLTDEFPAGDIARGAKAAESLQCGVCHPGMPMAPAHAAAPLDAIFKKDWAVAGCVASIDKRGKSPHLNLNDADRAALIAFAKTGDSSLRQDTATDYLKRQSEALRCNACHALDQRAAGLSETHSETAGLIAHLPNIHERVDQSRPPLTFTGEMLYTTAIEAMLDGTATPRPRPWLGMRMPSYRTHAKALATGLTRAHGLAVNKPAEVKVDPELAKIGRDLTHATGFGCTTCHGVGDLKPTAAFEVGGVNFSLTPSRIREEFFYRWMDNPLSVTPGTKMPRYSQDNKSQRTDVLGGDASKQFEAIWHYLHE